MDTEYCTIGIGICYDIRFYEYAHLMAQQAQVLCYPANFALRTGELHFDLLKRARAVDNQCYVMACACATNAEEGELFQSWGHSGVVSPWGKVLEEAAQEERVVYADVELKEVDEVR